jgi:hypothetical protein
LSGNSDPAAFSAADRGRVLLRRGRLLEWITLAWNVVGIVVLAIAAIGAEIFQPGLLAPRVAAASREEA